MTVSRILIALIILLISPNIVAQNPCINGFATQTIDGVTTSYPCDGYDLISRVPISTLATTLGTEEGSDIWGWTDPLNGDEYAIIATTNSTAFVNITDPINPVFLGRIETANGNTSFWRDVKVYNNHAYIVADGVGSHGMQIFDLTNLRLGVNADLTYTSDPADGNVQVFNGDNGISIGSCHNIVINESEGIAYLVGCGGAANGGPVFVDISSPLNPTIVGSYSAAGYTHDAQVITYNGTDTNADISGVSSYVGREILLASNGGSNDRVVVLDVTDKSNPQFISEITYPTPGYAHQGWFTEDHRYFIFGDETDEQSFGNNTRTFVFDMLDLDNPVLSSIYFGPSAAIDHNGYVKGNTFYLANYRAGMRVLDISNIGAPLNALTEINYFDTYPNNNGTAFNGAWSIYPYFNSGNIVISDIERGLFVVRASNNPLSTEEFKLETAFTISPNPTKLTSTIKASEGQTITSVSIYNVLGKKLFSKSNINVDTFVLPIQQFSNGMYLIKINNSISKKLVVNK
ncbi:choice-of-anchor B family protein [Olleya aquimaris]|uniref:Choice-of-anchor B domain-containing protein n=1 Tax=Olleya aquimaris TaxID=639310 RepID=A0A327RP07_9FLAO|nr:choice-of-anchor B family protein [Olleya aquimaris]RAJ18055.1 choice-of-anchor B domain-containing protein [Olleya aquimaris]